jgi:hypothetical protein
MQLAWTLGAMTFLASCIGMVRAEGSSVNEMTYIWANSSNSQQRGAFRLIAERSLGLSVHRDRDTDPIEATWLNQLLGIEIVEKEADTLSDVLARILGSLLARQHLSELWEGITEEEWEALEKLAAAFPHAKLAGHDISEEGELSKLSPQEIDYGRAFLVGQLKDRKMVRLYEAALDLIALQVRSLLPKDCRDEQRIEAMNYVLYHQLGFQFPPQSQQHLWGTQYTFLPEVLDNVRGVCLGISSLYLALGQRLNLELEAVLPPGHIYLRHKKVDDMGMVRYQNIETTLRGVSFPTWFYVSPHATRLKGRDRMALLSEPYWNGAISALVQKDYVAALQFLTKANCFAPTDYKVAEMYGIALLLQGKDRSKGVEWLRRSQDLRQLDTPDLFSDAIAEDLLSGACEPSLLQYLFPLPNETQEELKNKLAKLEHALNESPSWRLGWILLAQLQIELGKYDLGEQTLLRLESWAGDWPLLWLTLCSYYSEQSLWGKGFPYYQQVRALLSERFDDPYFDYLDMLYQQASPQLYFQSKD